MPVLFFSGEASGKFFFLPEGPGGSIGSPGGRAIGTGEQCGGDLILQLLAIFVEGYIIRDLDVWMGEINLGEFCPFQEATNCELISRLGDKGIYVSVSGKVDLTLSH